MEENYESRRASARIPTEYGEFELEMFDYSGSEDFALKMGDVAGEGILARVHSECFTGEVLGSLRCDCREQLSRAMKKIADEGRGAIIYLRQEGRGIGLKRKILAYKLQDERGLDTVQANEQLGLAVDAREYGKAAQMLRELGVKSVRLLTNNPLKISGLEKNGIVVEKRIPLIPTPHKHNIAYLKAKKEKLGHLL